MKVSHAALLRPIAQHVGNFESGVGNRLMRFRQKLLAGLWVLATGIAMTGWLAGLAWTTIWLIQRIIS
jgi:hypothetical protein